MWRIICDSGRSAQAQMAYDVQLAEAAQPTARFFTWMPVAISFGYKQSMPQRWNQEAWRSAGLEAIERPTGGGIALHGSDVSISVVIPREWNWSVATMMEQVCGSATRLCESYGVQADALLDTSSSGRIAYCLTETSPYAVMVRGQKLAGFALRRFPQSWLIQGSLLVREVPTELLQQLPVSVTTQLRDRAVSLSRAAGQLFTPYHGSPACQGGEEVAGTPKPRASARGTGFTETDVAHRWSETWLREVEYSYTAVESHAWEEVNNAAR